MAKFSGTRTRPNVYGSVRTTSTPTPTHEGGQGWVREPKSELFVLAVCNMVSETTFYEAAKDRDNRFRTLIQEVTRQDPDWVARFVPFLRDTMQMRSASVVLAAEYVKAGGPNGRQVVASALSRADEPAEMLAYWMREFGRNLPQPIKRGVADAVARLYNERSLLKYDGTNSVWRFSDVIQLAHARPQDERQSALFKYALDRRHGRGEVTEALPVLRAEAQLRSIDPADRRAFLTRALSDPESEEARSWKTAGWTWERVSEWLPGGMDAQAWESVIPRMGYMALLRNLRNFDQAGISNATVKHVADKLADRDEVAKSRQFPFRFLSAMKAVNSVRWLPAIEEALNHSLANVPALPGKTLILVDASGSMHDRMSGRSEAQRWEVAALFGAALGLRAENADLFAYSGSHQRIALDKGASVLRVAEKCMKWPGAGGGTYTWGTVQATYQGHDRVIILTDEQAHDRYGPAHEQIPLLYTFNVGGYRPAHNQTGQKGRYSFAGLTDAAFRLIPLLEAGERQEWPF